MEKSVVGFLSVLVGVAAWTMPVRAAVTATPMVFDDDFADETASVPYWSFSGESRWYEDGWQRTQVGSGAWNGAYETWSATTAGFTGESINKSRASLHVNNGSHINKAWCYIEYELTFTTGSIRWRLDRPGDANMTAKLYINGEQVYNGFGSLSWGSWSAGVDISNRGRTIKFQTSQNDWEGWEPDANLVYDNTFDSAVVSGAVVSLQFHVGDGGGNNQPTGSQLRVRVSYDSGPAPVAVTGTMVLDGYTGDNATAGAKFEFTAMDDGDNFTQFVELSSDGHFQVDNVPPGEYAVAVKAMNSLRAVLPSHVIVSANPTVIADPIVLTMGDINGDNVVSFEDFSVLQNSYGDRGVSANPLSLAAANGGCGALGLLLMAGLSLAAAGLGWRSRN